MSSDRVWVVEERNEKGKWQPFFPDVNRPPAVFLTQDEADHEHRRFKDQGKLYGDDGRVVPYVRKSSPEPR